MISYLVCTSRTGLIRSVFPIAGKTVALMVPVVLAALVALVAPVAVSPVAWRRT
jgi:hypothetical protein